jgi:hypothetical protein
MDQLTTETTAALRARAREAEEAGRFHDAAGLYRAALRAYPATYAKSELAKRDREGLQNAADRCTEAGLDPAEPVCRCAPCDSRRRRIARVAS